MGRATAHFFWPRPLGPWGGAKRSNVIKFKLLSQFQRFFKPTFLLTHERYKTYRTRFSFSRMGLAPGVGLGGSVGGWGSFFFSKFKQIWCVGYLHEWHMQRRHFLVPSWGLGEGPKGQISLNLNYKSHFQRF